MCTRLAYANPVTRIISSFLSHVNYFCTKSIAQPVTVIKFDTIGHQIVGRYQRFVEREFHFNGTARRILLQLEKGWWKSR